MSRPFGKHYDFRHCKCPGLEETLTELYDMLDTLADERVLKTEDKEDQYETSLNKLHSGEVPFDGLRVGHSEEGRSLAHINMYRVPFATLNNLASGASAKLAFTLPADLSKLKRGTGVCGYLENGHTAYDYYASANVNGLFTTEWTIEHAAASPNDFNGTLSCRVFNISGTSTIDIAAANAEVMLFIPKDY